MTVNNTFKNFNNIKSHLQTSQYDFMAQACQERSYKQFGGLHHSFARCDSNAFENVNLKSLLYSNALNDIFLLVAKLERLLFKACWSKQHHSS